MEQGVKPMKFFAFGLGDDLVSDRIGKFRVNLKGEDLKVVSCAESRFSEIDRVKNEIGERKFNTLYCLETYDECVLDYPIDSAQKDSSVKITFEACRGEDTCLSFTEIEAELENRQFFFPIEQVYFETHVADLLAQQKLSYSLHEQSFKVSVLPGIH